MANKTKKLKKKRHQATTGTLLGTRTPSPPHRTTKTMPLLQGLPPRHLLWKKREMEGNARDRETKRNAERERTKGQRWGRRGGALPDLAPPPPLPGAQSSSLDSPWRRLSLATLGKRRDTTSAGGEEGCCVQRRRGGRPLACRRRSLNEGRCVRQRRGGRSHSP